VTPLDHAQAAIARADTECRDAIEQARTALATTAEYVVSGDATGKRLLLPARAMAVGMLAHIEAAYKRNHS
jgi:hypothetical protein